jgi:hypothetical protein
MNSWTRASRTAKNFAGTLTLFVVFCSTAQAAGPQVAQIKTVSGQAEILRNGARTRARIGDPLFEKDTIETGADGAIGITFIDNTVMSSGANSQIILEDYKFNSSNFTGSMLTDMNRGTLSMVSGDMREARPVR